MGGFKILGRASGSGAFKELDREAGTGAWKTLEWESVNVDVGAVPEYGNAYAAGATRTLLCTTNPANDNGTLDKFDVYIYSVENGKLRVGVVELISGNTYKCRSAQDISGLSSGLNSDIAVNLAVETGDYLAIYLVNSGDPLLNSAYPRVQSSAGAGKRFNGNALVVGNQYDYSITWNYELQAYLSNY